MKKLFVCASAALCSILINPASASAQGTAFTYQGRLSSGGSPAAGTYDLRFTIYDSTNGPGVLIAGPITNGATAVSNGLFTVTLDFGTGVFTGPNYWLEVGVRTNGGSSFTALAPRQPITPTPYAVMANSASNLLGVLPSTQLAGTYGNPVNFNNGANSFAGDGSGLGNLNASQLASGTVPDARLAANVARTNQVWLLNGNAGTTPVTNFLGTSDSNSLTLKVNGKGAVRFEPTYDTPNVVGGWSGNYVQPGLPGAFIGGGGTVLPFNSQPQPNSIISNGYYGTIAGGYNNTVKGYGGGILAGSVNVAGDFGTIGGGQFESALGTYSFIGGGNGNTVQTNATRGVIAGGYINTIQSGASYSFIGGGVYNQAGGVGSFVGGGGYDGSQYPGNINNGNAAVLVGGMANTIESTADRSFIGGGYYNTIFSNNEDGVIVGGYNNQIVTGGTSSFIGGGSGNMIYSSNTRNTIAGGYYNFIQSSAPNAFIGGGSYNVIWPGSGDAAVAGGVNNIILSAAPQSFIGAGYYNTISFSNNASVIGGGYGNTILPYAAYSVIGGGVYNSIAGDINLFTNFAIIGSTIGGGYANQIGDNSEYSTIAGGEFNNVLANSPNATISGGVFNTVKTNASYATITGGSGNEAGGPGAAIPGGYSNIADGNDSFAFGTYARALHNGSFVISDWTYAYFPSTADNQFSARFSGGVRFETSGAGMTIDGQQVLAGTVGSGQLSGTYSSMVFFSNPLNSFNGNGSGLTGLNAAQLTAGTLPNVAFSGVYSNTLTFNNGANSFTGGFTGDGSGLTGLNAGQLTSGTVPAGRFSGNYTNAVTMTNAANVFSGNGSGLTNLNASQLAGGTVPAGRFSGNYTNAVTLTNAANVFAGNGGGLTNLSASQLVNGTVPSGALSGTYSGTVNFNSGADSFTGTFAGDGSGLTNLNASQLASGTVPAGRFSGTYTNAVTLTNAGNAFAGNGTGLTNVNAATLNGQAASAFAAASGSANYIQNQTASPQSASFNISGSATVGSSATIGGNSSVSGTAAANALVVTNSFQIASNGLIRIANAGIGTSTAAFTQLTVATNVIGDQTIIYNPLCDGDPNAILIATHYYGAAGGTVANSFHNHPIGVFYNSVAGHWTIYNDDGLNMASNIAFNVLIIKR